MADKKTDDHSELQDLEDLNTSDESSSFGEIKINNTVIAKIVTIAAREVPGVIAIGSGSLMDEMIERLSSKRDAAAGVAVTEDDNGRYIITLRVVLTFGIDLARTAYNIQNAVRESVNNMTNKEVAQVDVIIDDVKQAISKPPRKEESSHPLPYTD